MEKITKIILSTNDSKEIQRIIVVKENKLERYSLDDYSQDSLREIYSKYIFILEKQYKNILEGLDIQQIVNKLAMIGKIEENNDLLIVNINYYEDDNIEKVVVNYENGQFKRKLISKEELDKLLIELSKTYGIYDNNYLTTLKNMGLLSKSKKKKIKNLKINRQVLSYLVALGMAGGIFGGIKLYNKNNNGEYDTKQIIPIETPYNISNDTLEETQNKEVIDFFDDTPCEEPIDEEIDDFFEKELNDEENSNQLIDKLFLQEAIRNFVYNNVNFDKIHNYVEDILNEYNDVNNKVIVNYLDNVNESSNLTTLEINKDKFIILSTNKGYSKILSIEGKQKPDGCFETSAAYAKDIYADSKACSKSGKRMNENVIASDNEQKILQIMAKEILEGRTCIIRVNGAKGKRHFVLVVGLRKGYDKDNLKQSDFLIADPTTAGLKILNTDFGGQKRYLYKKEDDKIWGNRESDSSGYMIALSNNIEEYISNEVSVGIVPWVTYVPEEPKKL